eukprot:s996_g38.t1
MRSCRTDESDTADEESFRKPRKDSRHTEASHADWDWENWKDPNAGWTENWQGSWQFWCMCPTFAIFLVLFLILPKGTPDNFWCGASFSSSCTGVDFFDNGDCNDTSCPSTPTRTCSTSLVVTSLRSSSSVISPVVRYSERTLSHHHSRDRPFLRRIASAAKEMASGQNAPWKCTQCRQLVKRTSAFCPRCQTHWQQTMDHSYIHGQKQAQQNVAPQNLQSTHQQDWTSDPSAWSQQGWNRQRSKSRGHTPKGRRAKSANRQHQEGPGPPLVQYPAPPQIATPPPRKGAFLAPPPPPSTPWPGYGISGQGMSPPMMFAPVQSQMMPPMMHMGPPPHMQQQHSQQPVTAPCAPVSMQHPAPPAVASASPMVMDAETKVFVELARARQSELPEDMRKKVQQLSKKEGAKATRNFHSAVRLQGLARSELEEALQARANLISPWRTFIAEAVKTWQDHTSLFQAQEIELQDRIQQAQKKFAEAKTIVEETKEEAGKVPTTIEVHDTDDEELMKDRESATNSTVKIKDSLIHLTSSLQQLHEQAMTIDSEEKASKRPRTSSPRIEDLDMENKLDADSKLPASTSF